MSDKVIKLDLAKLLELLREEFASEENEGFKRLSQIPSTHIIKFLKYYRSLQPENAAILRTALARRALQSICYHLAKDDGMFKMTTDEADASKHYANSMAQIWWGEETHSLKGLTNAAAAQKAGVKGFESYFSDESLTWALSLKSAKANELRKLIKYTLAQRFGLQPEKHGGGVWYYRNPVTQPQLEVCIDYGGRSSQLRCNVTLRDEKRGLLFERLSFEQMMGLSFSNWDFIVEGQADQKIALLTDLIDYVLQFHRRLIMECVLSS